MRESNPRWRTWIFAIALLILAAILPFVLSPYWQHVTIVAYFYALLASSWAMLAGKTGLFSLAHMALMTIGAYTSGLLGYYLAFPPLLGILLGTLLSGLIGFLIAVLCLRLKATYLALFTIAFAEILRNVLAGEHQFTRGARGLQTTALFGETVSKVPYYFVMLGALVGGLILMYAILRSPAGLYLQAIREDEQAAAARGVDVVRYRVMAFLVTSLLAGMAGGVYAHYLPIITPNMMVLSEMGLVIAMAIIGGVESLIAAAGGAVLTEFALEMLRPLEHWRLVIFGGLLVLTLRFAQNGLLALAIGMVSRVFRTRSSHLVGE